MHEEGRVKAPPSVDAVELRSIPGDKAGGIPCADGIDEENRQSPRAEVMKQLSTVDFMSNAMMFYTRLGRIMFKSFDAYPHESAKSCVYRATRLINCFAQIAVAISVVAAFGSMKLSVNEATFGAWFVMRIISPLFYLTESKIGCSSKMGSLICWIFFFVVFLVAQGTATSTLTSKNTLENNLQLQAYVVNVIIVECCLWDCIVLPVLMGYLASSLASFRKFFPTLSSVRYIPGNEKEIQDRKDAFKELTRK